MNIHLQSLLNHIQDKEQLHVLLRKADTLIEFVTEEEREYLFLSFKDSHSSYSDGGTHRITVVGSKECIAEVLDGRVPLRKMQKMNKLKIHGNFRQILLLESLLLLSKKG